MPMVDTKEGDSDEQLQLVDVTVAFFFSLFFLWVSSKTHKDMCGNGILRVIAHVW